MRLIPMNAEAFQGFAARSIEGYAQDLSRTYGVSEAPAAESATADFNDLLPLGMDTEGHYFYHLCLDQSVEVGVLWMAVVEEPPLPRKLFVYDLEIHQPFRRQGLGKRALSAVEQWCRERGIGRMELNVFSDNQAARKLYEASGMAVCEMTLRKDF
jgi:GNAT superfamily N-acetyltransferase